MTKPKQHGGTRPNSGRKPLGDNMTRHNVSLPADEVETLRKLGNGSISAGILLLLQSIKK